MLGQAALVPRVDCGNVLVPFGTVLILFESPLQLS